MVPRFGQELGVVAEEDLDASSGSARQVPPVDRCPLSVHCLGRSSRPADLPAQGVEPPPQYVRLLPDFRRLDMKNAVAAYTKQSLQTEENW
ncbi:hypothetical protein OOK36_06670 [Streptomyces sp. NBC_00365]|uniref:hypothetical protein n=1 Tax=Streptomyces sp. NBC_00365 TaxID=2975726 RepID=UPI0022566E25|nr:hypothetical protein [Streptomyces sp. NBC_00365]MCX5088582.1 hypothetical protein [Streptomyces sp. NBC_00365]